MVRPWPGAACQLPSRVLGIPREEWKSVLVAASPRRGSELLSVLAVPPLGSAQFPAVLALDLSSFVPAVVWRAWLS